MALPWQGAHPARNITMEVLKFSSRIAAGGDRVAGTQARRWVVGCIEQAVLPLRRVAGWRVFWQWHGMSPEQEGRSGGRLCVTPSHVRAAQRAMLWIGAMCFGLVHGRSKVGARAGQ